MAEEACDMAASSSLERAHELGSASAAEALGRLFAQARVSMGPAEALAGSPHANDATFAIGFTLEGALSGGFVLAAPNPGWELLASTLLRHPVTLADAAAREALAELANIVASSFLNGISRLARRPLLPSVPHLGQVASGSAGAALAVLGPNALVSPVMIELGSGTARAALIASIDDRAALLSSGQD